MATPEHIINEIDRLAGVLMVADEEMADNPEVMDLGFEHGGINIVYPTMSDCMRFTVDPFDEYGEAVVRGWIRRARRLEAALHTAATTGQFYYTRVFEGPGHAYLLGEFMHHATDQLRSIRRDPGCIHPGVDEACSTVDMEHWPEGVMFGPWFERVMSVNFVRVGD